MVEFKRDRETGINYLMEVNGRLWGSLQLAIDAGVDFPAMIVDGARGITPGKVTSYAVGISMRTFWGDFDHLLVRMRHSVGALDLPSGSPGRVRALLNFIRVSRREKLETLRFGDPNPFVFDTLRYLKVRLGLASGAVAAAAVTRAV